MTAALPAMSWLGVVLIAAVAFVDAQWPSEPKDVLVLKSKVEDGVRISYKEVSVLFMPMMLLHLLTNVASHLRNHTRREVLQRLCSPSIKCEGADVLSHEHILLVLRSAQRSSECSAGYLDERWSRSFFSSGSTE